MEKSATTTVYEEGNYLAGRHGGLSDATAEALNKSSDGDGGIFWTGLLDGGDERAADDRGVCEFTDGGEVFGTGDAEADRDGQFRKAAQAFDELFGVGFERGPRAGDAHAREGVDESLRGGADAFETGIRTGGRSQEYRREMMAMESFEVLAGFFDDHVGNEDAIDAGLRRGCAEVFEAEAENGIVVGEDNEAGLGPLETKGGGEGEYVVEAGAVLHGALAGALDDGAVGERIAEGDAELEDVRARINGGDGDVVGGREVGRD